MSTMTMQRNNSFLPWLALAVIVALATLVLPPVIYSPSAAAITPPSATAARPWS